MSRLVLLLTLVLLAPAARADDPKPEAPPAPRTIVLLRHGHYVPQPQVDPGISPLGIAQARLAGARLAGWPKAFDAVLASPVQRAQDSAKVVAEALRGAGIETFPSLAECTPPTPRAEGIPATELEGCGRKLERVFTERFVPARGAPRRELWVCHGNVIRYLTMRALGVDSKAWTQLSVGHTSLTTILVLPDGGMQVIGIGDVGHLPANLLTGTAADVDRTLAIPAP